MYKAIDLADYIVQQCASSNCPITNLQLQQILYYVQINFYFNFDKPAFLEEILATEHGPMIEIVNQKYQIHGRHRILPTKETDFYFFCKKEKELIDLISETCMKYAPSHLLKRSQRENEPWDQIYQKKPNSVIPKELIKEYAQQVKSLPDYC